MKNHGFPRNIYIYIIYIDIISRNYGLSTSRVTMKSREYLFGMGNQGDLR